MNKSLYNKPINIAVLYSIFTLTLYIGGPYAFPSHNRLLLVIFVLITNMAMYIGFKNGANHNYTTKRAYKRVNVDKLLKVTFVIALIISIPKFIIYTGFYDNPIGRIIKSIILFSTGNSDVIYAARQDLGNAIGIWRYINYAVVLFGPIHWMYTPLSMFFWKRLSFFMKCGTLFIWLIYVTQYICTGTNVGLFEFFISLFIVKILRNLYNSNNIPKVKKTNSYNLILIVVLGVILLFAFNFVMSSRIGDSTSSCPIGRQRALLNHASIFWEYVPMSIQRVFMYVTRYVCAPYYALERAFDLPFTSTYGIGYSWFLLDNYPVDFWPDTYMMKLEAAIGYKHWTYWHTSYLWFANDVSFFGVPIIFFFLFKLFGKCWALFLQSKNMCAFLLFMLFVKMVFFISANNQAFQASDHFFAFWELLLFLGVSRKYNWKNA